MDSIGEKFNTGRVLCTRGVNDLMLKDELFRMFVHESLLRHTLGDWGELCLDDKRRNERALTEGERLFSAYKSKSFPKVWIITESDRASTCILFPDEY